MRIRIIFYMTGQKITYKNVLPEALNRFEKPEDER